ncbi:MAG: transglycosylase domain-containing protein, partial [Verrucomicrobiota bacterium]
MRKDIRKFFKWTAILGSLGLAAFIALLFWAHETAKPYASYLEKLDPLLYPITVQTDDGTEIAHIRPFQGRLVDRNDWVELDEISTMTQEVLVRLEDASFDYHYGVNPVAIVRATLKTLLGIREGASTLESQIIRNVFDGTFRPYGEGEPFPKLIGLREGGFGEYKRKVLEFYLATNFSLRYTDPDAERSKRKDAVLLAYFNICHFAPERRGINYASRRYLGKNPGNLDLLESRLLARTPNRPRWVTQQSKWRNVAEEATRDLIRNGHFPGNDESYKIGSDYKFSVGPAFGGKIEPRENAAFHHAIKEAAWWLSQAQETEFAVPPGSRIELSINADLQKAVFEAVSQLPEGAEGAVVVLDTKTGQIKALVGGKGDHGSCRATTVRIKGMDSTLKPLIALAALEKGVISNSHSLVIDQAIYGSWPENFGRGWSGEKTLQEAITRSLNPWAVKYGLLANDTLRDILLNLKIPPP